MGFHRLPRISEGTGASPRRPGWSRPIFNNILIFNIAESQAEALSDPDAKLRALFEFSRKKGIKLNKERVKLCCTEVKFMGHMICQDSLKPDSDKVQGITEMPASTSKQDLKRFLGMVNYLQKIASNFSEVTTPMRDPLKEKNKFHWDEEVLGHSFKQS